MCAISGFVVLYWIGTLPVKMTAPINRFSSLCKGDGPEASAYRLAADFRDEGFSSRVVHTDNPSWRSLIS